MERSEFNNLLNDIEQIDEGDIQALEALRIKYPYFQNLHFLLAKAYQKSNPEKLKSALNKAAIYAVDRAYLKKILYGQHEFVDVIRTEPLPGLKPGITDDVLREVIRKPAESGPTESEPAKPASSPTKEAAEKSKDVVTELDENLRQLEERKRIMSALLSDDPRQERQPVPGKRKLVNKESQIQLIEKFIKNEPRMGKQELTVDESSNDQKDLAEISLEHSGKFLTETLAKLMVKQKKYSKAVEIYEKLKLKFPKKTTYFASQIEKIKEIRNV